MIKKLLLVAVAVLFAATSSFAQGSRRQEITLSYGVAPVTDWIDSYSNLLSGSVVGADTKSTGWGAVTVGYGFRLIGGLKIGAQVVYSSNSQTVQGTGSDVSYRYWSVVPNLKWNWLNLKIVSIYARVGAGVTFARASYEARSEKSTQLAFQVSPLGVEVGGRLAAYAEAGIGTSGSLVAGIRYRF